MMPVWGGAKLLRATEETLPGPGTSYPVWHCGSVEVANNLMKTRGKVYLNINYN